MEERGNISFWFSEDVITSWVCQEKSNEPGRPVTYSDEAIKTLLLIKAVFKLPYRALVGFAKSLVKLLKLDIEIPSYSQISRRARLLGQEIKRLISKKVIAIVIDSTGLKVYGEGEWKVRQHGISKRRTWRKFHAAIDEASGEIVVGALTENSVADSDVFPQLIEAVSEKVEKAYADGAYDKKKCYKASKKKNIELIAPPQKNAVIHHKEVDWELRNKACLRIKQLGNDNEARRKWKIEVNYHRRSLVETGMFRFKQLFTDKLASRRLDAQKAEVWAKSIALNKMTALGMPKGEWIT